MQKMPAEIPTAKATGSVVLPGDTYVRMLFRMELMREALEQAQSCLSDETPEDMSRDDAQSDTLERIREALNYVI